MIAGIDFSTKAVDVVLLEEDDNTAEALRFELPGRTAFEAARSVAHFLPRSGWWRDHGIYLVGIEQPFGVSFRSASALMRVQGAIIATIGFPPAMPNRALVEIPPHEWKRELGLSGNANKLDVAKRVHELYPETQYGWGQDALDAYGIAYAVRGLCERAAVAA